ncbi:MAG: Spy/CpxP family protein refolding chaperone [Burkholderiaceae bacterium]
MKSIVKPLLLSVLLASAGMVAIAQSSGTAGTTMTGAHARGHMDPAKMQQHMAARMATLKAKLNLNGAQEGTWAQYMAAMQPPADAGKNMGREERQKMREEWKTMTTPQRIDRMNAMKTERDAQMRKRTDATLAFYTALSPEQQQVFDANAFMGMGGPRGERGHGHHGDKPMKHG